MEKPNLPLFALNLMHTQPTILGVFLYNFHTLNLGIIFWSTLLISVLSVYLHLWDFWPPMYPCPHPLSDLGIFWKAIFSVRFCAIWTKVPIGHMRWVGWRDCEYGIINATMDIRAHMMWWPAGVCWEALQDSHPQNIPCKPCPISHLSVYQYLTYFLCL